MNLQQLYIFLILRENYRRCHAKKIEINEAAKTKVFFECLVYSID